jgi:hypothetical protein
VSPTRPGLSKKKVLLELLLLLRKLSVRYSKESFVETVSRESERTVPYSELTLPKSKGQLIGNTTVYMSCNW